MARFRCEPLGEGGELAVGERSDGLDDGTLSLFGFATIRMQALGLASLPPTRVVSGVGGAGSGS